MRRICYSLGLFKTVLDLMPMTIQVVNLVISLEELSYLDLKFKLFDGRLRTDVYCKKNRHTNTVQADLQ